jgi:hypothetical protein
MTQRTRRLSHPKRAAKNATQKIQTPTPPKSRKRRTQRTPVEAAPRKPTAQAAASKQAQLAALLVRDEGATLDQMIALTGWLPHTTRAALTGFKKKGYAIDSDKVDGVRTYRAVPPQ